MDSTNYLIIQVSFAVLTFLFVGLFVKEIFSGLATSSLTSEQKGKWKFKIIAGLLLWLAFVSALSLSGFLQNFSSFPPRLMIVLAIPLASILVITFSFTLKKILRRIPPRNLIRLQVFRVFVEILLWRLFVENLLPEQMTFEGRNFDILAGLTAPFIAYLFI